MYKKGLAYKLLSFFSLLNLSLQPFFNFLLISAPAFALAQEQIEAGITFDKGKNSFNLTVNKPGEIHYELFYRTDSQIENVSGTSKNDGGSFSQEIYAGTCSSGGNCTPHQVLRGILKIEVESEKWLASKRFTIDNDNLKLVEESAASGLDLTDEENSWLENQSQPTSTATAKQPEQGELSVVILDNVSAASIESMEFDLATEDIEQSASLVTDKADYAPTDTVLISGSDFNPNETYILVISSTDKPPLNFETQMTADENGSFIYAYQLDGISRPNYSVRVKDGEVVIATTSFTDNYAPNFQCTTDTEGLNDDPGQKDLTQMCRDLNSANPLSITWNWDEITMPGSNTADACSLFDTDNDGFANYSLCVTWGNGQVQSTVSPNLYSCDDSRVDRCGGRTSVTINGTTACSVGNGAEPFLAPGGSGHPNDTKASCSIDLTDVGGATVANLLDVCSYPSDIPNSDPSDCVVIRFDKGNLNIIKNVVPDDTSTNWDFNVSGATPYSVSINGDGTSGIRSVGLGTYSITETAGTGADLNNYSTAWSCTKNGSAYLSGSGTTATGIVIDKNENTNDSVICTFTNTRINNASITIVKDSLPDSSQDFGFTTTGVGLSNFSLVDDDTDATLSNTKTFSNLLPGSYTVTETSGDFVSWALTDLVCTDPTGNSSVDKPNRKANINLAAGENVTCTYTNTMGGVIGGYKYEDLDGNVLTLGDRVIVSGWTIQLYQNGEPKVSTTTTSDGYSFGDLLPGDYTVKEASQDGWFELSPLVDGHGVINVSLSAGQQTYTNNFINTRHASVTIFKSVDTDGDGDIDTADAKDWFWNKDGSGHYPTGTIMSRLMPGTYTFSEEPKTGFHITSLICNNGVSGAPNDYGAVESQSIAISSGQNLVCTFTNTRDTGTIELKKVWSGTAGQTTLKIGTSSGGNQIDSQLTGADGISDLTTGTNTVPTGTYYLSESGGLSDYNSSLSCTDNGQTATVGTDNSISVEKDHTIICTFTNTRNTEVLKVVKVLTNDNGGSLKKEDFSFKINNGDNIIFESDGTNEITLPTGTYTVTENTINGYTTTYNNCENVSVTPGGTTTCTITNDDQPATLIVKKVVTNDNGGTKTTSDFSFNVNSGTAVTFEADGQNDLTVAAGTYNVTEPSVAGYSTTYNNCSNLIIANGGTQTCAITNDDIAPKLTLIKTVINDNGGVLIVSSFPLFIDGVSAISGTAYEVRANKEISVTETTQTGYTPSVWGGDCSEDGKITLLPGDNKTCTITNDDIQPKLTVTKVVNGGSKQVSDFPLFVDGSSVTSGQQIGINAGQHTVSETNQPHYNSVISGDCSSDGKITLSPGDVKSCTIINTYVPYCGDGHKDTGEECDGTDGVGENQFCTSNCKLVPIYDGEHACPAGTVRSINPIATYNISGTDSDGEIFSLTSGGKYLFEAVGDYSYGQGRVADSAYAASGTNWGTSIRTDIGIWGANRGVTSLLGDFGTGEIGVIKWDNDENYNTDHIYTKFYQSTGSPVRFLISDWYSDWYVSTYNNQSGMNDNSGSLTLKIYECQNYGSISGYKYEDKNGNGQQDSDENNLLSGWTIKLKNESGSDPIASTTTDTSGNYQFSNVLPGNYQVCEINQTGWWVTDPQEGYISGEACKDITVYAGQSSSVNFGNFKGVSIGGYKFGDLNGDSQKNEGELYLNGWLIHLYKLTERVWSMVGSHPTGSLSGQETGEYGWGINGPGTYFVCEVIADHPNWVQTYPNTTTTNAVINQSGNTREAPFCYQITTSSGVDNNNLNFGNFKLGMAQGRKFKDLNHNGTKDDGDSYLDNWDIYLFDSGWNQLKTMKTGDDSTEAGNVETGQYRFINLEKGDYYICEDKKAGWNQTRPSSGLVHNGSTCYSVSITTSGQEATDLTFGNFELGKVQGMKYDDEDGDGAPHEAGEGFMNEWTIRLYTDWEEPTEVVTSNTGTKGQYRYVDLFPGIYQVCEVLNKGWTQTWPKVGDVPVEDNGTAHPAYGTAVVNLSGATDEGPVCWQTIINSSGDFNQLLRFGNTQYGSVEVYKFEDLDGDGKKDGGEPLLPDWEILLGNQTATTSAQGKATFTNLVAGEYNLNENLKGGWQQTNIYCTSDEAQTEPTPTPTLTPTPTTPLLSRVLGVNPVFAQQIANNNSHQVIVNPGEITTCYIGNFQLGSISGYKIYDKDDNGIQDKGEGGIEGWEIYLSGGSLIKKEISTLTDSKGYYEFTGLAAGDYTVSEEKRNGWRASNPESGKSDLITISSGTDAKFDFLNAPPVSIVLTKSNNATAPVKPGDLVEYTLTITVGERTLSEMTLIDVLPDGFSYQTNTSKITTTLGDSTATVKSEPTLKRANKKLVWTWPAGIAGGSVVVVKYTVKINATNKPSSYTNFAFVWGSGSPTLVESQIVDSVVKIEPAYAPEGKVAGGEVLSAATQTTGQIEGQVLGATLPAAGANTWFLLAAIALIGAGLALRPKKKENRQKN